MSGPINPKEVQARKNAKIPDEVFQVFNELIVDNWDGHSATVMQDDAAKKIAKKLKITTEQVYARSLLDIEGIYRKAGWKVEYDKPGYCETYEAFFRFTKK